MEVADEYLEEMRAISPDPTVKEAGGLTYIHLPRITAPNGTVMGALLCLQGRDGYLTRLFLSEPVPGKGNNWTAHQILDKTWHTWSWNHVEANQRPMEIFAAHMKALR